MTDMRVLKASNKLTQTVNSSAGAVSFEEGIATEFTDGQAKHFTEKLRGYEVVSLSVKKVDPPLREAEPVVDAETEEAKDQDTGPSFDGPMLTGNIKELPGVVVVMYDVGTGGVLAQTTSDEKGNYSLPEHSEPYEVKFFGHADVSEEDIFTGPDVEVSELEKDISEDKTVTESEQVPPEGGEKVVDETKTTAESKESPKGSSENVIKLPVLQDSVKKITKFCKTYDIKYEGTKAEMVEKIYADSRFAPKK